MWSFASNIVTGDTTLYAKWRYPDVLVETFENGNGTTLADWTIVNGSQTNKWYIGTAISNGGSKSAYISDNSSSNTYTIDNSSVVHLYRDITFPTSTSAVTLTFYWKGVGESNFDDLKVFVLPTSTTPLAGTSLAGSYTALG
ncbi:hypothetical protein, partial [Candidatus Symbiothrix dinenymphae]|uniref:hypothetical protein n=1 Tax=Candidatus Symbiothrix dinenymphae TaxID=467085 RepID=UPI0021CDBB4D